VFAARAFALARAGESALRLASQVLAPQQFLAATKRLEIATGGAWELCGVYPLAR
jgi:hypothetical protein